MSLPFHVRAAALLTAVGATAVVINVMAELGHPPPDGQDMISRLLPGVGAPTLPLALTAVEGPSAPTATLVAVEPE